MKGIFKKIRDKISKITDVLFSGPLGENDTDMYVLSVRVFQMTTNNGQVLHRTIRELLRCSLDEIIITDEQLMKKILKENPIQTDEGIYITPQSVTSIVLIKDTTKFV